MRDDIKHKTLIIWVPTWRCPQSCAYCDYKTGLGTENGTYVLEAFGREHIIGRHLEPAEWLTALKRFEPYHLEITGGEPTTYAGLKDVFAGIPETCSFCVTSNTLNRHGILSLPATTKCLNWAASYHYHDAQDFMDNAQILRSKGYPVAVTLVLTPQNVLVCAETARMFQHKKVFVNVHPMLKKGHDWTQNMGAIETMKQLGDGVNVITEIPMRFEGVRFEQCSAGNNYFMVFPDGQVWRCYSSILSADPVGDIRHYEQTAGLEPCSIECVFPCDLKGAQKR